jgi:hypothetical protein
MDTTIHTSLHERLRIAAGTRTYRELGELTHTNHETVRRYMLGQAPSSDFVAAVCSGLGINAQWLLMGTGAMRTTDIRNHALSEAKTSELLSATFLTLQRLVDRVEHLESCIPVLEAHMHASEGDPRFSIQTPTPGTNMWTMNPPIQGIEAPAPEAIHAQASTYQSTRARISSVISAVPKRPRSSAG